ncbi:hypothetical protein LTS15_002471 [Exophiala xenobiotica]|nr:hypothetical protein LTS15_002471 [Exophiala xenobiotica]
MGPQIWRYVPGKALMFLTNLFTAVALIFEGYNQGVLGTVSGTPGFIDMAQIGANGVVTDTTKQGGLAAAYYFGAMWGCFIGGWLGDKLGRKKGVWIGSVFCILGSALMAGSTNSNMFICARIIAGIGIGFINAIIPPWVNELSQAHDRGSTFSLVFVANFAGIVIAYWLNFGLRTSGEAFRWRFPLAFMAIPMIIVALTVFLLPESPRWLISHGGRQEAIDILRKLRGDLPHDDPKLLLEIEQLDAVIEASHHKRNNFINIVLGGRYSGQLHYGRRALMGMALQTIQQWTGILAIATWASVLFGLAGFDEYKSAWLGGLVNTFGIFGTAGAALVIDRLGRVKSLIVSFITQGICLIIVGVLIKVSEEKAASNPALATQLGTGAGAFVFIFLVCFTVFNIVPCWIYGSEIFPTEIRSKGYGFTIFGWAIGCGMTTFVIPIMLNRLGWATFIFFAAMNAVSGPIIYLFYPEVANKTLEEIDLLFTSNSLLVKKNMQEYHRRVAEAGGNVAVAARRLLDEVDGTTHLDPRRVSVVESANDKDAERYHVQDVEK